MLPRLYPHAHKHRRLLPGVLSRTLALLSWIEARLSRALSRCRLRSMEGAARWTGHANLPPGWNSREGDLPSANKGQIY
ncbi:hypothetical protein E2C01_047114 [Portunus trituberculatus]|uniref:Uncharacterized protein n=1 Tax=Portunus trituberculatus TaxID=210409 RepID=A0A5B7G6V9_PORTR|nr:hypothetical protein [Portunus trituberculatus]